MFKPIMVDNYATSLNAHRGSTGVSLLLLAAQGSLRRAVTEPVSPRFWFIMVVIMINLFVLDDLLTS